MTPKKQTGARGLVPVDIDDDTVRRWQVNLAALEDRLRQQLGTLMKPADHQSAEKLATAAQAARRVLASTSP